MHKLGNVETYLSIGCAGSSSTSTKLSFNEHETINMIK